MKKSKSKVLYTYVVSSDTFIYFTKGSITIPTGMFCTFSKSWMKFTRKNSRVSESPWFSTMEKVRILYRIGAYGFSVSLNTDNNRNNWLIAANLYNCDPYLSPDFNVFTILFVISSSASIYSVKAIQSSHRKPIATCLPCLSVTS